MVWYTVLLCCCKDVEPLKVVKVAVTFLTTFLAFFMYLFCSDFTFWWTALWASFVIAVGFTVGVTVNSFLRCAAALFPIQACSRFGILMIFLSLSWMVMQLGLSSFRRNERLGDSILHDKDEGERNIPRLEVVDYILGVLHYTVLVPIFFIYVYSVLYEVTYEGRQFYKRSKERSSRGQILFACEEFASTAMTFVVGSVWTLTSFSYGCQWYSYARLATKFETRGFDVSQLEKCSVGWLIFYNCSCLIFLVLKKNSHIILKFRHVIIRRFFSYEMGNIRNQQDDYYLKKRKEKRNSKKAKTKKRTRAKQTGYNETDTVPTNSGHVSDESNIQVQFNVENEQVKMHKKKFKKPRLPGVHNQATQHNNRLNETLDSVSHYSNDSNVRNGSSDSSDCEEETLEKNPKYVDSSD